MLNFINFLWEIFLQVVGPPRFLNNHVQEEAAKGEDDGRRWRHGVRRNRRDKKDLPAGNFLLVFKYV